MTVALRIPTVQTPTAYCNCLSGYYFTGTTCEPCGKKILGCEDCSQDGTICYYCPTSSGNFELNGTICSCIANYYLAGEICLPCPYWCYECTSPTVCTNWNSDYGYIDDGTGTYFVCDNANGYYAVGIYCVYCWDSITGCTSCSSLSVCTQCASWITRLAVSESGTCECTTGVFEPWTQTCISCANCCPYG